MRFFRFSSGIFLTQVFVATVFFTLFSTRALAESLGGMAVSGINVAKNQSLPTAFQAEILELTNEKTNEKNNEKANEEIDEDINEDNDKGISKETAVENLTDPLSIPKKRQKSTALSTNNFVEGQDYFAYGIPVKQRKLQDKVRIQSFFDYDCRVCVETADVVNMYAGINSDKVHLDEYPVATDDDSYSAQVYYSLKALNREDVSDQLLFESKDASRYKYLAKFNHLIPWLAKHQIEKEQFKSIFYSELVTRQVRSAIARTEKYGVFTYPFVVVDGKYVLTISTLYDDDYAFAVLDYLVNKAGYAESE